MYNTDMDYKKLETEPWQDFPMSVSQEFRLEALRGLCGTACTEHDGVEYQVDFTINVAKIDGKRVKARYVDYIPRKDSYEAEIVDTLCDAGGGAEKKDFLKVLEHCWTKNGSNKAFNREAVLEAIERLKNRNWINEWAREQPYEFWYELRHECLAIKDDLEHGRKSFEYK
jgi:hypothetical protein